jgi:uncharacterized repeat protein (TIGR03843 family)
MAGQAPNGTPNDHENKNNQDDQPDNESQIDGSNSSRLSPLRDAAQIKHLLACGAISEAYGMLRWSSNHTFLVGVADGDETLQAVYKPQRGERPLWDFPDGTLCYRETAAYLVSEALSWQLVPPTVLRDGPRGVGSLQYYVQNNPEVNYFSFEERHAAQLMALAAFDYVINNADRKGGHCLLDSDEHLWAIDHGIAFHSMPKLRTVVWDFAGQRVPEPLVADLQRFCAALEDTQSRLRFDLDKLLAESEIAALMARTRRLLSRREYPRPGPGPNYPWPPV